MSGEQTKTVGSRFSRPRAAAVRGARLLIELRPLVACERSIRDNR